MVHFSSAFPAISSIYRHFNGSRISTSTKKAPRETQTLRAGCSKAESKNFAPLQIPFPVAQDGQNLINWRWSLLSPTDPVWWRSMHAISSYRDNRPTNKQINPQTNRQDPLQYTAPLSLASSVITWVGSTLLSFRQRWPARLYGWVSAWLIIFERKYWSLWSFDCVE